MPTYQYSCKMCGHQLEEFQSMTEDPLVRCPACSTDNLVRSIGSGSGLIFKGSGFYLTDYKKRSSTGGGESEKSGNSGSSDAKKE